MADQAQMPVRCHGCAYFFITHEPTRPYMAVPNSASRRKSCQQQLSLKTTGIQCAYRQSRSSAQNGRRSKPEESLMAGELNSVQESIKLALDAADAATDVTSEYSQVKREHKKLEKKCHRFTVIPPLLLSPELSRRLWR